MPWWRQKEPGIIPNQEDRRRNLDNHISVLINFLTIGKEAQRKLELHQLLQPKFPGCGTPANQVKEEKTWWNKQTATPKHTDERYSNSVGSNAGESWSFLLTAPLAALEQVQGNISRTFKAVTIITTTTVFLYCSVLYGKKSTPDIMSDGKPEGS